MRTTFDPAVVPDPFRPIMSAEGRGTPHFRSLRRQRDRRAAILATTRRLLAQDQEHFTLRRISEECEITVQTIRNAFGRREDLLVSALNEHTTAIWQALASVSSGSMLFLDLAQMYHHCASVTPTFLRGMVTAAISGNLPLAVLQRHGSLIKVEYLREMARREMLRPGVNIEALAAQITRLNTFMMYEWVIGGDAEELRHQMISGNKLLLMGAMQSARAAEIEAWMPHHRA